MRGFLFCKKIKNSGFTILELLVVVAIIGILSAISFSLLNSANNRAKVGRARAEMKEFITVAIIAQGETGGRLQNITGLNCTDCPCRTIDIRNIDATHLCYTRWDNALNLIQNATGGIITGMERMTRDPWKSPYALDENERESGPTDCRYDRLRSAGPDGYLSTADDILFDIPFAIPCP